jgi:uncharacterized protein DUF3567
MQMVYNSDNFVVVQFDFPAGVTAEVDGPDTLARGGYEIVDKFARKEIFIEGALAEQFKLGVEALVETSPSEEEMDAYLEGYASLMQHALILH